MLQAFRSDLTEQPRNCSISVRDETPETTLPRRTGPPISADSSRCSGCLICELRCALRFEKAFRPASAAIIIRRQVNSPTEYSITFTEQCDQCGICARYCSYGALAQEEKAGAA